MNTLTNVTINPSFERGVHSVVKLQKKCEGTTINPTPKSATVEVLNVITVLNVIKS